MVRSANFAFILILPFTVFAQPQPDTLWTRQFGGAADETISALCSDGQGGFFLAGNCGFNGDELGPQDYYVCRVDSGGTLLWQQTYGIPDSSEIGTDAVVTVSGDVVVAGHTFDPFTLDGHPSMIRLSPEGALVWARTYEMSSVSEFKSVRELEGGDLIVAGRSWNEGTQQDFWAGRFTPGGDTVWTHALPDSGNEYVADLAVASNSDVLLSSRSHDLTGDGHLRVRRLGPEGDLVWSHDYDPPPPTNWYSTDARLAIYPNGDIVVGATADVDWSILLWLLRLNSNGDTLWSRWYGYGFDWNSIGGLSLSADGGIEAIMHLGSYPAPQFNLIKVGPTGIMQWQRGFLFGDHFLSACDVLQCSDLGFAIGGSCFNYSNQEDAFLIKTGPELIDAALEPPALLPGKISLSAYPNPFNAQTHILYSLPAAERVKISIANLTGREVAVLADDQFTAGEHRLAFDATDLPSGVYFVNVRGRGYAATKKLLLLK